MFSDYPEMMSINDIKNALRIGRSTAYNLVRSGEIRSFKIGSTFRVPKTFLIDFVENTDSSHTIVEKRM